MRTDMGINQRKAMNDKITSHSIKAQSAVNGNKRHESEEKGGTGYYKCWRS